MAITGTDMGNVQLPDPHTRGLRLERHAGLSEEFVDYFALVDGPGTACAAAETEVALRTVHDMHTDPVFSEGARRAVLEAGSRACHSIPLVGTDGRCVGMVSAHLAAPTAELTAAQVRALTAIGGQAGRWLGRHQETVVRDALEYLHALATRHRRGHPHR
ncbi:GAF domain-containing protein [Streptomyces indicus]|uniref:GAF domain-containing protein n=2 Tax=Streptomyces indicus TaxID=417292 RepID=A0A1G8UML5_9ACTN|nr:GAF domain-containing protein [Streptomyces indicus]